MKNYIAFLDESGGHGFDFSKQGTSTHFVVCAIIIDKVTESDFSAKFLQIKSHIFS